MLFSHNIFEICLLLMRQNEYLWSKELTPNVFTPPSPPPPFPKHKFLCILESDCLSIYLSILFFILSVYKQLVILYCELLTILLPLYGNWIDTLIKSKLCMMLFSTIFSLWFEDYLPMNLEMFVKLPVLGLALSVCLACFVMKIGR